MTFLERFESRIHKVDDCHVWTGAINERGYGHVSQNGKMRRCHRVAWEIYRGPIPPKTCVLHRCDNRACVRIEHLFLGDEADNSADMIAKGRSNAGERNPRAKLSEANVTLIRSILKRGANAVDIADTFSVSRRCITDIANGHTWKHVSDGVANV